MPDKFCVNCVHCEEIPAQSLHYCRLEVGHRNLVTGKELNLLCSYARTPIGACGPDGNHYKEREDAH